MAEIYKVQQGECAGDVPTMIRVIRICRNCGAKIFPDAPEGLCTGCVLETALGISPDAVVADQENEAANRRMGESARSPSPRFAVSGCSHVGRIRRLRVVGGNRTRRSGGGISCPAKEPQSHGCLKSHQPWRVGEQSA